MESNIPSHPSFRPNPPRSLQQQQHQQQHHHQTLPSLPQQIYSHPGNGSHTPAAPSTPQPFHPSNGFSNLPTQQDRAMPPPPSFGQPASLMNAHQHMMATSSAVSNAQILSSATPTSRLPDLLPAPQPGLGAQTPLPPFNYGQPQQVLPQQSLHSPTDPPPTHVVGSQGRRGVLPSAPGRPVALPGTAIAGKGQPQKDAEGKYPCEHCNKTYLHLKHLKRHMLRHTGDRPYQCHLCKDTFSRSDILKRHFQKCSLRRGNPTGANHLQHSQSHLRKNSQQANRLSMSSMAESSYQPPMDQANLVNGHLPASTGPPMPSGGMQTDPINYQNGVHPLSNRSSRSNSGAHPPSALQSHRNSLSSISHLSSARQSFDHPQMANNFSTGVSASGMPSYALPHALSSHVGSQDLSYSTSASGSPMNPHMKTEESAVQGYSRPHLPQYDGAHTGLSTELDWQHIFSQQNHDPFALAGHANHDAAIKHQPGSGHSTNIHSPTDGVPNSLNLPHSHLA